MSSSLALNISPDTKRDLIMQRASLLTRADKTSIIRIVGNYKNKDEIMHDEQDCEIVTINLDGLNDTAVDCIYTIAERRINTLK